MAGNTDSLRVAFKRHALFMLLFFYHSLIAVMLVDGAVFTKYAIALCATVPLCLYIFLNFNK